MILKFDLYFERSDIMIITYKGKKPNISKAAFTADNSTIIGDVVIQEGSSVWFGAVIRGDEDSIVIGRNSNIQDNCTLHGDVGKPVIIGNNVTVGHNAVVHGCTVGDGSLIGMNSTILDGAKIGKNCIVGAGAVVTENKVFEDNTLIIGVPARAVAVLDSQAKEKIKLNAAHYVKKAKDYAN